MCTASTAPRQRIPLGIFLVSLLAAVVLAAPAALQQDDAKDGAPHGDAPKVADQDAPQAVVAQQHDLLNPVHHREDELHQQLHESIRRQDEEAARRAANVPAADPNHLPPSDNNNNHPHLQALAPAAVAPPLPGADLGAHPPANPNAQGAEDDDDAAHAQVLDTSQDAQALQERLLIVERLLRLKDAQVRDAVDTSRYYSAAYRSNIAKIKELNRKVESSVKGGKAMKEDLDKKLKVERELREKLEKDEDMLRQLENSLSSARRAASDPAIALWIRRRVESLARLIQDEESAKVLGRVVGDAVDDTRKSVVSLESKVEHRVHHQGLAVFACFLVILLPILSVRWALGHITKALSYRQHILLGSLFNFILLSCLVSSIVIFRNDPMVTIRKLAPHYFVLLQIFFVVQWPIMFYLIMYTIFTAQTVQERLRYVAQQMLFTCVVVHVVVVARTNVLISAAKPAPSNLLNYVLYDLCVLVMLVLTLTGPRNRTEGLINDVSNIVHKGVGDAVALATGEDPPFSGAGAEKRRFVRVDDEVMSAISSSNGDLHVENPVDSTKAE